MDTSEISQAAISNCFDIAAIAVLYYDYMLTFSEEVRYIWPKWQSFGAWLFLLNRYVAFFSTLTLIGDFFTWTSNQRYVLKRLLELATDSFQYQLRALPRLPLIDLRVHRAYCIQYVLHAASLFSGLNALPTGSVNMFLRVYALYGHDKRVLAMICSVAFPLIGICGWNFSRQDTKTAINYGCHLLLEPSNAARSALSWEAMLFYDILIFSLTAFKTLTAMRRYREYRLWNLTTVILRDGAMYYVIMTCAKLSNVLTFYLCPPLLMGLSSPLAGSISVTMVSRTMLDLHRMLSYDGTTNRTAGAAGSVSSVVFFTSRIDLPATATADSNENHACGVEAERTETAATVPEALSNSPNNGARSMRIVNVYLGIAIMFCCTKHPSVIADRFGERVIPHKSSLDHGCCAPIPLIRTVYEYADTDAVEGMTRSESAVGSERLSISIDCLLFSSMLAIRELLHSGTAIRPRITSITSSTWDLAADFFDPFFSAPATRDAVAVEKIRHQEAETSYVLYKNWPAMDNTEFTPTSQHYLHHYLDLCSFVVLFYHYLLTLDEEYIFIWKKLRSMSSWLFLLSISTCIFYFFYEFSSIFTTQVCMSFSFTPSVKTEKDAGLRHKLHDHTDVTAAQGVCFVWKEQSCRYGSVRSRDGGIISWDRELFQQCLFMHVHALMAGSHQCYPYYYRLASPHSMGWNCLDPHAAQGPRRQCVATEEPFEPNLARWCLILYSNDWRKHVKYDHIFCCDARTQRLLKLICKQRVTNIDISTHPQLT
ncbi:hypothetical protein NM688_g1073 [Phlebia brevispora]|uniref:Uncharacterized protein n=1 Tax=Phlebia brevispora TaxID=194682 RepID=A0ACC1TCS2_9APHY|nr:hypothetical protein NM688_g1073 [Phlebia brevispora]